MSQKTWLEEFYPKSAQEFMTEEEAIVHSLTKWTGLRPENLAKHGMVAKAYQIESEIRQPGEDAFRIDATTCALCDKFYDDSSDYYDDEDNQIMCASCPIYEVRGYPCDEQIPYEEEEAPYFEFANGNDIKNPEPMIYWLVKALDNYQDNNRISEEQKRDVMDKINKKLKEEAR